jgi:hypothetical protein
MSEVIKFGAYTYVDRIIRSLNMVRKPCQGIRSKKVVTKELKADEAQNTHLTVEEARKALVSMSRADMIRLRRSEIIFSRSNPNSMLLSDAITKTLEGVRSWKRGMTVYAHLYGAMKSLAHNDYKKSKIYQTEAFTDDTGNEKPQIALQVCTPSPEVLNIEAGYQEECEEKAKAEAKEVFELFANDEDAMWLLMGWMDDKTAREIQEISGMDKKKYDTTYKRITRNLTKRFPDKKKN